MQSTSFQVRVSRLVVLECSLVWNGQLLATLSATCSQYLTAIGSSHSLTETVLVNSLTARRLVSSFHCHSCICFIVFVPLLLSITLHLRGAKVQRFLLNANEMRKKNGFYLFIALYKPLFVAKATPRRGLFRRVLPYHTALQARLWLAISLPMCRLWLVGHHPLYDRVVQRRGRESIAPYRLCRSYQW